MTPCTCPRKCFDKFRDDQIKKLFDGFWESGDFNTQNAYLCGCTKTIETKRKYTSSEVSRRKCTRVFYLSSEGIDVQVCKVAFLRIFGISNGRLDRALRAQILNSGSPHNDMRGKHAPGNKTSEDSIATVKAHIECFPKYKSHYSRADNPYRQYLSPDLSIAKMYSLYQEKCSEDETEPVSEWVYRKVFNEDYNLHFGR